jgi:hypothetical protein
MGGLMLTFYDAALCFVTSRLQNLAGTGGRRDLFIAGSRIGGDPQSDDVAGSDRRAGIVLDSLRDPIDGIQAGNQLADFGFPG